MPWFNLVAFLPFFLVLITIGKVRNVVPIFFRSYKRSPVFRPVFGFARVCVFIDIFDLLCIYLLCSLTIN